MSNEYMFGLDHTNHSRAEGKRRAAIAQKHGADYTGPVNLPGNSVRGWFTCNNLGSPFNERTAKAVLAAVGTKT